MFILRKILCFLCILSTVHSYAQVYLSDYYKITTIPKENLNQMPGITPIYDVDVYYIQYHTTDAGNHSVLASGAFMLPVTDSCNQFPLVSFQHGTVLRKADVPSRNNSEAIVGQLFATVGYVAAMPDYLGLGDSPGLHPYLHAETEAKATIDLLRACRELMNDTLNISDNGQLFLAGYSQGGHATMATHKYIEDNKLTTEFNITASAPGAGPYDLSGAQAEMVFLNPAYPRQGYIIYLLFAFNNVYQNMFSNPSEVLKPPYDVSIPPYLNGNYNMTQLNNALPDSLHEYLQDSVYQMLLDHYTKTHPVFQNLALNDNYDWKPLAPLRMLYCQSDEQVSYLNSVNALQHMQANGAIDVQAINLNTNGTHGSCTGPALLFMMNWFNSLMIPCNNTSHTEEMNTAEIKLNPNPTNGKLAIEGLLQTDEIKIFNTLGILIMSIKTPSEETYNLDLTHLQTGIYIIKLVRNNNILRNFKLIINK